MHNDGESLESWRQRNERLRREWSSAKHPNGNGNGMGMPLAIAVKEVAGEGDDGLLPTPRAIDGRPKSNGPRPDTVTGMFLYDETGRRRASDERVELLKTPTSQLAVNGGSQHPHKRRGGGHGPTLADQAEHELELAMLPTPRAQERQQSNSRDAGVALSQWVLDETGLLPTPGASDGGGGPRQVPAERTHRGEDHGPRLRDVVPTLLPTPDTTHGRETSRTSDLLPGAVGSLGTTALVDWGKYARAIVRWEQATGRLVPHPLEPGKRGKGRLSPAFVEWMMGLTPGWVTQVPGLSRNAQLKILGNGVVPQQAYYAQQLLLGRAGDLVVAALRAAVEAS